jgi:hypothetical protein
LLVPVHSELDVHAAHPIAMHVSPPVQAGPALHMQVPATQALALLPQSASMQQLVTEMHVPLQSFSLAEQEVTAPVSPVPESTALLDDAVWVEDELLPVVCLAVLALWDIAVVSPPESPPSAVLTVDEDEHPRRATLSASPHIDAPGSRMMLSSP